MGSALISLLERARIDKIYGPFPNLTLFQCFGKGTNFRFALRSDRQNPSIFLVNTRLNNPLVPSPPIMRLRKYLVGLHFGQGKIQISSRTLALPLMRRGETLRWLILDPLKGPILMSDLPEDFDLAPLWPDEESIKSLADRNFKKKPDFAPWEKYPVLTPMLRQSLAALAFPEAMALMVDLEMGGDKLFFYNALNDKTEEASLYSAWPLPDKILENRQLKEVKEASFYDDSPVPKVFRQSSLVDERKLLDDYSQVKTSTVVKPEKRQIRRLKRNLKHLDEDESRLNRMIERQNDALLIQENLWQLDPEEKKQKILLPRYLSSGGTEERVIKLNGEYSVIENMKRLFDRASKGKRGLIHIARRRRELERTLQKLISDEARIGASDQESNNAQTPIRKEESTNIKGVATFRSKDGYIILRGKNAQGNHRLLRHGQAHDYWLHSTDGPSAHVLIRRHHAKDVVPEETMLEAARLVAEKSWQKDDLKADIMVAMLRHVRTIKGAPAGAVRVNEVYRNIHLSLE